MREAVRQRLAALEKVKVKPQMAKPLPESKEALPDKIADKRTLQGERKVSAGPRRFSIATPTNLDPSQEAPNLALGATGCSMAGAASSEEAVGHVAAHDSE